MNREKNVPTYTDDSIQSEVSLHQARLYNAATEPPKNTGAWNEIGIHGTSLVRKTKEAPSTTATEPTQQVEAWNSERGISATSPIRINEERQHYSSRLPGSILKSPNQSSLSQLHSSDNTIDSLKTRDEATYITRDYSHRSERSTDTAYPNNTVASERTGFKNMQHIDPPNSTLYNKNYPEQRIHSSTSDKNYHVVLGEVSRINIVVN